LPEDVLKGDVDPDLLAKSALAGRSPCKAVLRKADGVAFLKEGVRMQKALYSLRLAECRFSYFWDRCYADVDSSRRASLLTFLLSLVTVVYGALPIYFGLFNGSNRRGSDCLFDTVQRLLAILTVGWSFCAVLYLESSFFARVLAKRKIGWEYVCTRLREELSREQ
jgi:hypothetical protein